MLPIINNPVRFREPLFRPTPFFSFRISISRRCLRCTLTLLCHGQQAAKRKKNSKRDSQRCFQLFLPQLATFGGTRPFFKSVIQLRSAWKGCSEREGEGKRRTRLFACLQEIALYVCDASPFHSVGTSTHVPFHPLYACVSGYLCVPALQPPLGLAPDDRWDSNGPSNGTFSLRRSKLRRPSFDSQNSRPIGLSLVQRASFESLRMHEAWIGVRG